MKRLLELKARATSLRLFLGIVMSKSSEKVYYAVGRGRQTGIYDSWKECKVQTEGISNAKYRKFFSLVEAEEFVNFWKNYSSPAKESDESQNSVSTNKKQNAGYEIGNKKELKNFKSSPCLNKNKDNFILEPNSNEDKSNINFKMYAESYTSPITTVIKQQLSSFNGKGRNSSVHLKSVNCKDNLEQSNRCKDPNPICYSSYSGAKVGFSLKKPKAVNKKADLTKPSQRSCHSSYSCAASPNCSIEHSQVLDSSAPLLTSPQNYSSACHCPCDENFHGVAVSEGLVGIVKEEVVEVGCQKHVPEQNDGCQTGENAPTSSDKLTESLKMLESALTMISKLGSDKSRMLENFLKTLLERVFTDTNAGVNLQMESTSNADNVCEDSKNCDKSTTADMQSSSGNDVHSSSHQDLFTSQVPQVHLRSFSPHSGSFEGRTEPRNVDVLALNLRLDSFEKRFDACLKEVGAIVSDISHIKSEIKEIKETLNSGSNYSTRKGNDGMLQTTLTFGSGGEGAATNRSYSTYQDGKFSKRVNSRSGKDLKRKLSRSESPISSKRSANDEEDHTELLSRVKTEAVDYTSFTLDEEDYVEVYTDGASRCNGRDDAKAGIGVWWGDSHPLNVAEPVAGPPTNNTAEIQAARIAIELAVKCGLKKLKIYTDSEFLINCATRWIHRWKKNGWHLVNGGPVKNRKELEKLDRVASKISIRWEKVPGHAGVRGNEMADRLANEGASKHRG